MPGERETGPHVLGRHGARRAAAQECRQRQQAVLVGLAGLGRHGTARSRRDVDEVGGGAGGRAGRQVEAEAQLLQQHQLPAHDKRRPYLRLVEVAQHEQRHLVEVGMGIALGQQAGQRRHGGERRERGRVLHDVGGKALPQLDAEVAEVVGKPRLPGGIDVIADLQDGPQLARASAVHQPEVPAVLAREQLEHRAGLARAAARSGSRLHRSTAWARLYTSLANRSAGNHAKAAASIAAIGTFGAENWRVGGANESWNVQCKREQPELSGQSNVRFRDRVVEPSDMFWRPAIGIDLRRPADAYAPQLWGDYAYRRFLHAPPFEASQPGPRHPRETGAVPPPASRVAAGSDKQRPPPGPRVGAGRLTSRPRSSLSMVGPARQPL